MPKTHASHTWHLCYLQPYLRIPAHSCMMLPPESSLRRAQITDKEDTRFITVQIMYRMYLISSKGPAMRTRLQCFLPGDHNLFCTVVEPLDSCSSGTFLMNSKFSFTCCFSVTNPLV